MPKNYTNICKYWQDLFNLEFVLLDREVRLYSRVLGQCRAIGRIDYVAKYKDITYLVEEDMDHSDRWHWVKIIAYKALYLAQNPTLNKDQVKCIAFVKDNEYTPDFTALAKGLDVEYVVFRLIDCSISVSDTSVSEVLKKPSGNSAYVAKRDRKDDNEVSNCLIL